MSRDSEAETSGIPPQLRDFRHLSQNRNRHRPVRATRPEPAFTLLLVNGIYPMGEIGGRRGFAQPNAIMKAAPARHRLLISCHVDDRFSPSAISALEKATHIIEHLNLAPKGLFVPDNHAFRGEFWRPRGGRYPIPGQRGHRPDRWWRYPRRYPVPNRNEVVAYIEAQSPLSMMSGRRIVFKK